jgi:NADPH:quinone reductase-like Zn-dependent oxidoreductase
MKAVAITGFGDIERVRVVDMDAPLPSADMVSIEARAAALNPADWKLREGWLADGFVPDFPFALGFDVAGIVTECAPGIANVSVGDRVVAKTAVGRGGAGGCAQLVTVPRHLVCRIDDRISFEQAAAIPTAGITAWEALFAVARIEPGQHVLINGGAGGTGSFAIAIARTAGARVAATARPENHRYLGQLGAETAFDYRAPDLVDIVRARYPDGFDLLLDTVGQGALQDPLALVRDGGAMVTIGTLVRDEPRPPPERGIRIETAMSSREREAGQLAALVEAIRSGRLALPEIEVIPARDAAAAIERLKAGHVRGKLVLSLQPGDWA